MIREDAEKVVYLAISIGEGLLENGAEVGRVEDTVSRVLAAYGSTREDVFSITSSLEVTAHFGDFRTVTQTRRIQSIRTDMTKVEMLNQLSRDICSADPPMDPEDAYRRYRDIISGYGSSELMQVLGYALVSGAFTVFFGGDAMDCIAAACIGIVLKGVDTLLNKGITNRLLMALLWSLCGGVLANLCTFAGFGHHADLISIGNIMLYIPGIAFTNSIRDLFYGDTITGLIRFFESVILAITIAVGFTAARLLF
jgi:uncharacterized membrane protein YjjP (DUF1212 family)